jgi:HAD superfamily phosphoserine phosphatase-like hydrolase
MPMEAQNLQKLVVFDLDGTLIPFDSLSRLIKPCLWRTPSLMMAGAMRKAGLMSRSGFAQRAHRMLSARFAQPDFVKEIAASLCAHTLPDRLALRDFWQSQGAHLVLLSASPEEYVREVGASLGFDQSFGSHFEEKTQKYIHLHGDAKRQWIETHFPAPHWHRVYAIADQASDLPLLCLFEKHARVTPEQKVPLP